MREIIPFVNFCVQKIYTMTDLDTEKQEENEDPDFYTDETLSYILGRISEEIIEDQLTYYSRYLTIRQVEDLFP